MAKRQSKLHLLSKIKIKKRTWIALWIIALVLPISLKLLFKPKQTAAWWDQSWQYRKAITITNSTTAQANVYISFDGTDVLDTSDVSRFQTDCGDIRFTNSSGQLLPFYPVAGCGTDSTDLDVQLTNFPAGEQIVYLYYGNATADNGFFTSSFSTEATNYTIGTIASEQTTPGPVAYWKFDEGSGTTTQDSSQKNKDGTFSDSPVWQPEDKCISGKCLFFDGSNDYVDFGNNYNYATTDSFTVSGWFKTTVANIDTADQGVVVKGAGGNCFNHAIFINTNGALAFGNTAATSQLSANGSIVTNTWYHFAVTYSNGTVTGFLNGVQQLSVSRTTSTCTASLKIGASSSSDRRFKGYIDEVKIYPFALTVDQIKQQTNQGQAVVLGAKDTGPISDGLVGYWKMDETSWSGTANEVLDYSGNNNHATSANGANIATGKFGNGGSFDGTDDYISLSDNATLSPGSGNYSINAWIKTNPGFASVGHIFSNFGSTVANKAILYINSNGTATCQFQDGNSNLISITSTSSVNNQQWHFISCVRNGTSAQLYINGVLANSATNTNITSINTTGLSKNIGKNATASSGYFNGAIDEVRVYNRALNPNEITTLYQYAPGPVLLLPLDEGTGTTSVSDTSGNGYIVNMTGSMTNDDWVTGKYGKALSLDGSNDYLETTTPINFDSNPFTFELWYKSPSVTSTSNTALISNYKTATTPAVELHIYGSSEGTNVGKAFIYVRDASSNVAVSASSARIDDNQWHHIVGVRDNSSNTIYLFVDGKRSGTAASSSAVGDVDSSQNLIFGSGTLNRFNTATIDDIRVYNYTRTPQQIVEDMNAGHPTGGSPVGSQLLYWKFDEGYGTTANDTVENYNGTLACTGTSCTNPTWLNSGKVNKALHFSAVTGDRGDYVTASPVNLGTTTGDALTISMWINPLSTETNYGWLVRNGRGTDENYGLNLASLSGGKYLVQASYYNGGFVTIQGTKRVIPQNAWSHVTAVFRQGEKVSLYVNGEFVEDIAWSGANSVAATTSFNIGGHAGTINQFFGGYIDEVKVYSSALTADQIKLDMNAGSGVVYGVSSNEADDLTDGAGNPPVSEWKFDEKTGTTANDTSGNGRNGSILGSSWKGGCAFGNCLEFPGVAGNYVDVTTTQDFNNSFSISLFTKIPTNFNLQGWIIGHAKGSWAGWYIGISAGKAVNFGISDSIGPDKACNFGTLSTDAWYNLAVTVDQSNDKIYCYLNGKLVSSSTTPTENDIDASNNIRIGQRPGSSDYPFMGLIDQVKIYDYARTPAQIAYDYNRGKPIAHYKMDECQGATINDASGNNNHGTLTIGASGTQTSVGTCSTSGAWYNGAEGKYSSAMTFDGTDDSIVVTNNTPINFSGTAPVSVSTWIYPTRGDGWNMFFSKGRYLGHNSAEKLVAFLFDSQDLYDPIGNTNYWFSSLSSITLNQWTHVVFTYDGVSIVRWYIDGVLDNEESLTGIQTSWGGNLLIGQYGSSNFWQGKMDDFRLYSYALSADQVKKVMNEGSAVRFGD